MKHRATKKEIACIVLLLVGFVSHAQQHFFTDVPESAFTNALQKRMIVPARFRTVRLDKTALLTFLQTVPQESYPLKINKNVILEIPMPKGDTAKFYIFESSAMAPELSAKFPNIKSYGGQGINDRTSTIKIDWTEFGFHAMILSPVSGSVFIDPYAQGNTD